MEDQGIMALPQAGMLAPTTAPTASPETEAAIAAFDQARTQMDPKEFGDDLLSAAEQTDPAAVQEFRRALQSLNLPPEVIDALGDMVDAILAEPQNYKEIRAEFIAQGVPEDILPPEFDPSYFGAMNLALDQISGQMGPMQPQGFAEGGIAMLPIPAGLASMGRGQDTMLAHISPAEARLLRRRGGAGTINPYTGQPEYLKKFFKSVGKAVGNTLKSVGKVISNTVKSVASAVKKFASSTVGRIVTTVALGFFLGPAAAGMLGVTSAAGVAAVSGFIGSAGSTLLAGGKVKDALKAGALGGLTAGAMAGFSGGMNAFQAGSYTGPTTVAGQVESFTNSLKSLGGASGAPADVVGQLSYTGQGEVLPGVGSTAGTAGFGAADVGAVPGYQYTPTAPAAPVAAPPAASMGNVIQPPEFVATAPGAGTQVASAGPVSNVGPVPGTPVAQTPEEFMRAAEFRNFGQAPADVPVMRIGQVDTGGGLGMVDRAIPTGGPTPEQIVGMPTPRGPVALGPEPKSFIDRTIDYFSPSAREAAGVQKAADTFNQTYQQVYDRVSNLPGQTQASASKAALDAATAAQKAATPGMFSTYAPIVGAGMGAAYLAGAFDPTQPKPPGIVPRETGFDLYNKSPTEYGVTPGGASTVYAPPSITPGYGTTTYTGSSSGYGQMGTPFAPPLFRVRDPREYLRGYAFGGAVRAAAKSAAAVAAAQQAAAEQNAPAKEAEPIVVPQGSATTQSAVVIPRTDKFGRQLPFASSPGTLRPELFLGNSPVTREVQVTTPAGMLEPVAAGILSQVDRRRFPGYGAGTSRFRNAPTFVINTPRGLAALAPRQFNMGGFAKGGAMPQNFPRRTGQISGPGTETSDSIPAMLSDGEFVMTAKAVRGAGGGSRREGAKRMYKMMRKLERNA